MKKTDFLPRLESLRGVAALIVVGYHASHRISGGVAYNWFDGFAWRVFTAVSNGTGAVVVFFVLSGFVLARSLESNSDPVRFLRNRVFRLFPAAMAVVALLTALHWRFGFFVGYEASFDPLDVLRSRRGVCQDFAHLQIGCLRSLGLAGRYVSGYVLTHPPPGQKRLVGSDASHAWVAAFVPSVGWVDFDPTNNCLPTDGHITLAWGRDYSDVSPIRGVLLGGAKHSLKVGVDVMPLE